MGEGMHEMEFMEAESNVSALCMEYASSGGRAGNGPFDGQDTKCACWLATSFAARCALRRPAGLHRTAVCSRPSSRCAVGGADPIFRYGKMGRHPAKGRRRGRFAEDEESEYEKYNVSNHEEYEAAREAKDNARGLYWMKAPHGWTLRELTRQEEAAKRRKDYSATQQQQVKAHAQAAATAQGGNKATAEAEEQRGKKLLSRFCAHYVRNTGLLSRDETY
eukprot:SAG31_NODE_2967_length_4841_cov_4.952552_7_plen_220_part_00